MIKKSSMASNLLLVAAGIIVIAGLKYAASMLVPFMLSVFLAMLILPIMRWMVRHRIPEVLAVAILLISLILLGMLVMTFIGGTLGAFYSDLPFYEARLNMLLLNLADQLYDVGITMPENILREYVNPYSIMRTATTLFNGLSGALTTIFLILFTVMFILLEASGFPAKVKRAFGEETQLPQHFQRIGETIQYYLILKTIISLVTGGFIWLGLALLDVPYAPLWGLLAFVLNYIPNIGSIVAAIPAILVSVITQDMWSATLVTTLYLAVNMVLGNIIEPRVMGRSLGLSPLVVFVSLVFWGWIWGPIGMILSIPLTMIAKIALETNPKSRWVAMLLDR